MTQRDTDSALQFSIPFPLPGKTRRHHLGRSEELNSACHLSGLVALPEEQQACEDLADAPGLLEAKRDPNVLDACRAEPEEVLVLREDDAVLRLAVGDVGFIPGTEQTGL